MKEEEERERDRYRRAYARWLRQSEFHQQQEQQHQYWDGQSFGHGWTEEEEKRRSQRGREGSEGWRMGWNRNEPHYQHLHLNTLGLVRYDNQYQFKCCCTALLIFNIGMMIKASWEDLLSGGNKGLFTSFSLLS